MLADRVLFLDGEALVVDKPAGLPVTPVRDGALSLDNHLDSLRFGYARWPRPAHRLDRDTSGCLLLGRNPKALARFGQAFEDGAVAKTYLALVDGVPDAEGGEIDMALAKVSSREEGWRMRPDPAGRPARTAWTRLAILGRRSLILFRPATGRTHQLRVHAAAALGTAIVGDPVYGRGAAGDGAGTMLHAWRLSVARANKPPVAAEAPLPERFLAAGVRPAMLDGA